MFLYHSHGGNSGWLISQSIEFSYWKPAAGFTKTDFDCDLDQTVKLKTS